MTDEPDVEEKPDKEQDFEVHLEVIIPGYGKRSQQRLLAQRAKKLLEVSMHKQVTVLLEEENDQWLVTYEKQFSDLSLDTVTIDKVLDEAVGLLGISKETLLSDVRRKDVVYARQITMYVIRMLVDQTSYPAIGTFFNRDHSTVVSSVQRVTKMIKESPETRKTVELLIARVRHSID